MRSELWAMLIYFRIHTFDLLQKVPSPMWAISRLLSCRSMVFPGQGQRYPQLHCHPAEEGITAATVRLPLQAAEASF